ncbi:MAG TPA: hypothetical protein V6D13_21125 [Halomicronema sp.]
MNEFSFFLLIFSSKTSQTFHAKKPADSAGWRKIAVLGGKPDTEKVSGIAIFFIEGLAISGSISFL